MELAASLDKPAIKAIARKLDATAALQLVYG